MANMTMTSTTMGNITMGSITRTTAIERKRSIMVTGVDITMPRNICTVLFGLFDLFIGQSSDPYTLYW